MNILIVKLSSLGDVVHAMPAVQDIRAALPAARIDWVVERAFAPLAERCTGVARVVPCELRKWRKAPLARQTRAEWRAFKGELQAQAYDAVVDLQGLVKSAVVARLARLAPGGKRYAMANQTEGSGYEAPTRWVADVAIRIEPRVHAVQRSRELCGQALGFVPAGAARYGLRAEAAPLQPSCVALVHGSSREDKCWPPGHWAELGRRLLARGHTLGLPQGSDAEEQRAAELARTLGAGAQVWPRMGLAALADRLAGCAGVIGVDSGLSHIAVALDLPHVQLYNFDTAWRTGPVGARRQQSLFGRPCPTVDGAWQAWLAVEGSR